jgi:hypothetical protein
MGEGRPSQRLQSFGANITEEIMENRTIGRRTHVIIVLATLVLIVGGESTVAQKGRSSSQATPKRRINVTGTWSLAVSFGPGLDGHSDLRLKQVGETLTVYDRDSVGFNRDTWIRQPNGKIKGNRIQFYLEGMHQGLQRIIYRGIVKDNAMKGTIDSGGTWTAKRS